jgi:hypothetical protein
VTRIEPFLGFTLAILANGCFHEAHLTDADLALLPTVSVAQEFVDNQ